MKVWIHVTSLVRLVNLGFVLVADFLLGFGPGLCTMERCCEDCYLPINGLFHMHSDMRILMVRQESPWALWGIILAWALTTLALVVLVTIGILGALASWKSRSLHPSTSGGLCSCGIMSSVTAGSLGMAWSFGHYHGLGHLEVRGWVIGAVCLYGAAFLFALDLFLSFAFFRQGQQIREHKWHSATPFLIHPKPLPILSISDTQDTPVVSEAKPKPATPKRMSAVTQRSSKGPSCRMSQKADTDRRTSRKAETDRSSPNTSIKVPENLTTSMGSNLTGESGQRRKNQSGSSHAFTRTRTSSNPSGDSGATVATPVAKIPKGPKGPRGPKGPKNPNDFSTHRFKKS